MVVAQQERRCWHEWFVQWSTGTGRASSCDRSRLEAQIHRLVECRRCPVARQVRVESQLVVYGVILAMV